MRLAGGWNWFRIVSNGWVCGFCYQELASEIYRTCQNERANIFCGVETTKGFTPTRRTVGGSTNMDLGKGVSLGVT